MCRRVTIDTSHFLGEVLRTSALWNAEEQNHRAHFVTSRANKSVGIKQVPLRSEPSNSNLALSRDCSNNASVSPPSRRQKKFQYHPSFLSHVSSPPRRVANAPAINHLPSRR